MSDFEDNDKTMELFRHFKDEMNKNIEEDDSISIQSIEFGECEEMEYDADDFYENCMMFPSNTENSHPFPLPFQYDNNFLNEYMNNNDNNDDDGDDDNEDDNEDVNDIDNDSDKEYIQFRRNNYTSDSDSDSNVENNDKEYLGNLYKNNLLPQPFLSFQSEKKKEDIKNIPSVFLPYNRNQMNTSYVCYGKNPMEGAGRAAPTNKWNISENKSEEKLSKPMILEFHKVMEMIKKEKKVESNQKTNENIKPQMMKIEISDNHFVDVIIPIKPIVKKSKNKIDTDTESVLDDKIIYDSNDPTTWKINDYSKREILTYLRNMRQEFDFTSLEDNLLEPYLPFTDMLHNRVIFETDYTLRNLLFEQSIKRRNALKHQFSLMVLERNQFQSRNAEDMIDENIIHIYKNKYNLHFDNLSIYFDETWKTMDKILKYHPHIHIQESSLHPTLKFDRDIKSSVFSYKFVNTLFISWLWRNEISYISYHKLIGTKIEYNSPRFYDFFKKENIDSYIKDNGISHSSILKMSFIIFYFYENQIYLSQKSFLKVFDKILELESNM
jgi:hypothetical protein